MRLPFAPAKLSLSALLLVSAPLLLQGCSEAPQQQQGQMHPAAVATMTMETHIFVLPAISWRTMQLIGSALSVRNWQKVRKKCSP